jgi:hypothetical protein
LNARERIVAINLTSAAGTGREPSATAAIQAVAVGSALVLLGLHAGVTLVEMLGWRVPGLAAVNPGQGGSLPALWGETMLILAALVAIGLGVFARNARLLTLAALPATLVMIEAGDLAAHLTTRAGQQLGGGSVVAKLAAELLVGTLVLSTLALSWPAFCLGRRAASALLAGLATSVACDLLAGWLGGGPDRGLLVASLAVVEESVELLLYAGVGATALGRAIELWVPDTVPFRDERHQSFGRFG